MLPSIHPQQRPKLPNNRILIRIRLDGHRARLRILHQPSPTRSLDSRQCRIELLLHPIKATIVAVDRLCQGAAGRLASALVLGRQVLPEETVVDVAAAVEVDEGLSRDERGRVVLGLRFGGFLFGGVQAVDIGLVVLAVVQLHDFARDGGLEGAVVV